MRNAFAAELTAQAARDERVVLLSGDIGNRLFDDFKARHPTRFLNCGVAEANMTGVAAGMAMCGLRPVTYTIVPFVTTRCLEQIRVDICYHDVPVVVVGVGGGLSYASLGATHHSCEDIAMMRSLPGMSVVCPCDSHEVRGAVQAALRHDGPVYIRLGKKGEAAVHDRDPDFSIGRALEVRGGTDVCLLATGNIMPVALAAAAQLEQDGLSTRVVSFHTVKPLDEQLLAAVFGGSYELVATVEEHSVIGGLGGAVAEWVADNAVAEAPLLRVGVRDEFLHQAGGQAYARAQYGLTSDAIVDRVLARIRAGDDRPMLRSA